MLAIHAVTAATFISNFQFWREASYFDAASHEKWLLHTWSLSVEWQFYIILPLGIMLIWRMLGKRGVQYVLCIVGLLSLVLSIYATPRWPSAAFYLFPTRAWEMLAGGLVWRLIRARAVPTQQARVMEAIGLAIILIATISCDVTVRWPSVYALLPTFGASSYSIYLWHWPLVVILNYLGSLNRPVSIILGIIL